MQRICQFCHLKGKNIFVEVSDEDAEAALLPTTHRCLDQTSICEMLSCCYAPAGSNGKADVDPFVPASE